MKEKELSEKEKEFVKKISDMELCPRCYHYICLKNGKCPHCGLVKKGDEWIMTKEAIKEKEIEEEKEKKKEKVYGGFFDGVITYDEGEKDGKGEKEEKE